MTLRCGQHILFIRARAQSPIEGSTGRSAHTHYFPHCGSWTRPHSLLDGLPSISTDRHVHGPPSSQGRLFILPFVAGYPAEGQMTASG
jgi:hypothetical protein